MVQILCSVKVPPYFLILLLPSLSSQQTAPASLALEQGSKLIVLDPFNLGYLTDSSVDVVQGFIGSEIVSANPNVLLGLEKDEKGWKFERIDIVEQNFLYPQIQNVLYNDFEDFNVNSANIGARFLRVQTMKIYEPSPIASFVGRRYAIVSFNGS